MRPDRVQSGEFSQADTNQRVETSQRLVEDVIATGAYIYISGIKKLKITLNTLECDF